MSYLHLGGVSIANGVAGGVGVVLQTSKSEGGRLLIVSMRNIGDVYLHTCTGEQTQVVNATTPLASMTKREIKIDKLKARQDNMMEVQW